MGAELSHQPVVQDWVFGSVVPPKPEPKFRLEVHGERDAGRIEPHLAGHPECLPGEAPKGRFDFMPNQSRFRTRKSRNDD